MEKNMARAVFVPTLPAAWCTRNFATGLAGDDRARVSQWVVQCSYGYAFVSFLMFVMSLCPASRLATRVYLNLSAGFAGDVRRRGKHCFSFMTMKEVRNGD